uniref:Parathyroid hormone-like hormone b n=1 Tax=Scophthalmus maximus TaxID=52904 RepID=A0A8D3A8B6_SCOMX
MCSVVLLHQWSLAVFLLCSPATLDGRPVDALSSRTRRSVSHAQLMHDKGRSLQEFKRRTWLQELLEEVHTADEQAPPVQSRTPSQTFSGNSLHQKPPGASKNLPDRFRLDKEGPNLPQETNKDQAYKDQPLKVATKRKKKVRLGRRRENDKRRRRARSVTITTKEPWRTQYPG